MESSNGWSAIIIHNNGNDWCHFVKEQQGLWISNNGLECQTLDHNVSRVLYKCDDNLTTEERTATIIFSQRVTGTKKNHTVTQEKSDKIEFYYRGGSSISFNVCTDNISSYNVFFANYIRPNIRVKINGADGGLCSEDNYTVYTDQKAYNEKRSFTVRIAFKDGTEASINVQFNGSTGTTTEYGSRTYDVTFNSGVFKRCGFVYDTDTVTTTRYITIPCDYTNCTCEIVADKPDTEMTCSGGTVTFSIKQSEECDCEETYSAVTETHEGSSSKRITVIFEPTAFACRSASTYTQKDCSGKFIASGETSGNVTLSANNFKVEWSVNDSRISLPTQKSGYISMVSSSPTSVEFLTDDVTMTDFNVTLKAIFTYSGGKVEKTFDYNVKVENTSC